MLRLQLHKLLNFVGNYLNTLTLAAGYFQVFKGVTFVLKPTDCFRS